jgi:hypothetical protein
LRKSKLKCGCGFDEGKKEAPDKHPELRQSVNCCELLASSCVHQGNLTPEGCLQQRTYSHNWSRITSISRIRHTRSRGAYQVMPSRRGSADLIWTAAGLFPRKRLSGNNDHRRKYKAVIGIILSRVLVISSEKNAAAN